MKCFQTSEMVSWNELYDERCKKTLIQIKTKILNRHSMRGKFLNWVVFSNSNQIIQFKILKIEQFKAKNIFWVLKHI